MNTSNGQQLETASTFKALQADVEALKRDLAKALGKLESRAAASADTLGKLIADTAGEITSDLSAHAHRAKKSLTGQIEQQPFASLAISFAVGFIISRVLPR